MAKLRVIRNGVEVQSLDLAKVSKPQLVVGRAEDADIRLDDRAVGRSHAVLMFNAGGVAIQKKSKFGKMAMNGTEISDSVIKTGDVVSIADYLLRFEEETAVVSAVVMPAPVVTSAPIESQEFSPDAAPPELSAPELEQQADITVQPAEPEMGDAAADSFNSVGEPSPNDSNAVQNFNPPSDNGFGAEDRTAMIPQAQVVTKLVFKPGDANAEEFLLKKPETYLGRGSSCEIILNDKKASRRHLLIRKVGMNFVAQDQGSGNGTYVNGVKISEQELAGDDVIRIGETEFTFKAISQEYFNQEQEFIPVPEEPAPIEAPLDLSAGMMDPNSGGMAQIQPATSFDSGQLAQAGDAGAMPSGGIPGLDAGGPSKKETLLDKFKRQPPIRKLLIGGVVGLVVFMAMFGDEEEDPKKKKANDKKPAANASKADVSFSSLPPEKQQFVMNAYQQAFDHYKNQQPEQAILQVDRLLGVIPTGYKDAIDIKQYSEKAIQIKKSIEDEKKRKELEEKLREEVAELVAKAQAAVDKGNDEEAKQIFGQVLEKDPDNPTIMRLRQQLEEKEQRKRAEEEEARERAFKLQALKTVLKEARDLLKAGQYYDCMDKLDNAPSIFAGHPDLIAEARDIVKQAKATLYAKVKPHVDAGNAAFGQGDYTTARDAYYRAVKIDPRNQQARSGLNKIRDILHDRSKRIYTDAVIAESVSDYRAALDKFRQCFATSMRDDVYYGRCFRKMKRFEMIERNGATADASPSLSPVAGSDPLPPALPGAIGEETSAAAGDQEVPIPPTPEGEASRSAASEKKAAPAQVAVPEPKPEGEEE